MFDRRVKVAATRDMREQNETHTEWEKQQLGRHVVEQVLCGEKSREWDRMVLSSEKRWWCENADDGAVGVERKKDWEKCVAFDEVDSVGWSVFVFVYGSAVAPTLIGGEKWIRVHGPRAKRAR